MSLTPPSVADLSGFSGRPVAAYVNTAYASTAAQQAADLVRIATSLSVDPDNPGDDEGLSFRILKNAKCEVADAIYLSQAYQAVKQAPFSSERMGSYSYQKLAAAVIENQPTGLTWFDQAREWFNPTNDIEYSSISVFEYDNVWRDPESGHLQVMGPKDLEPGFYGIEAPYRRDPHVIDPD